MAVTATSNVDEVNAWLHDVVSGFSFKSTTEGGTLGEDCAHIVADGIIDRSISRQAGAREPWRALGPKYKARKERKYNVGLIGIRTGQMLSLASVLGQLAITTGDVQILYGTGQAPTRSSASAYISDQDKQTSDVEKAWFFSDARPFYELDDAISEAVFVHVEDTLAEYLGHQ